MDEQMEKPADSGQTGGDERWARDIISQLAFATLVEQRRKRRWGIFFKFLFFLYLLALILVAYSPIDEQSTLGKRHTALVRIDGLIASSTDANADNVIAGLRAAFKNDKTAGVILRINSPGGSPVQAGEVYDEIMRLRKLYPNIPIYAVALDICASGGYYIATASQKIFANKASIVGSIGVRMDSFGFVNAMEKLGIERRLYTAGDNKAFLDPFSPSQPQDVQHIQGMLEDIHQQFVTAVKNGRGERLRETPDLFSGLVWTGEQSLKLGLVDDLADVRHVAEDIIGAKTVVDYTRRTRLIERIFDGVETNLSQLLLRHLGIESLNPIR
jgi:protease-4